MIVHLIANHQQRYLQYALICVHSLIARGQVDPQDIHLVTNETWRDHEAIPILRGYGVVIHFRSYIGGKFVELERLLQNTEGYGMVVQLDVDTILTQDIDFKNACEAMLACNNFGCYIQKADPRRIQKQRMIPQLVNPRFLWDTVDGHDRFSWMLEALFDMSLTEYLERLDNFTHWLFGGMILIRENIIGYQQWKSMVAMNTLVHCDETVMMLAMLSSIYIHGLNNEILPHVVNPKDGLADYLQKDQSGILHYAGDWYREQNPENKAAIESIYQSLVN